jgi:hypothetical protein
MSKAVITIEDVDDDHISVKVEFTPALSREFDKIPLAHLMAMNAMNHLRDREDLDAVMEA